MAGLLAAGAQAATIRDQDASGDAARRTLIQFPKLSFSLASGTERNWTGSPLAVAGEVARLDSATVNVASGGVANPPTTAADAGPSVMIPTAASPLLSVSAAPSGPASAGQDRSSAASVPEPASIVMIGVASFALYFFGRRWTRQHQAA